MKRFLLLPLALLLAGAPAAAGSLPVPDFASRLEAAAARGEIDAAQAALYRLFAAVAPERLPPDLRTDERGAALREAADGGALPLVRCATPLLRAVRARLDELGPEDRAAAEAYLSPARPAAVRQAGRTGAKTVAHVLPYWIETANFSVEWGPDLTNEDGTLPLQDDDPVLGGDGIPDVAQRWASYFEASFGAEAAMGYTDPTVAAELIPVFLGNSWSGSPIDDIGFGTYALTNYDGQSIPYIVVNNNLHFVPSNDAGPSRIAEIRGAMRITAAHELFHVFHFLYEPAVWRQLQDDWWFEASATWMEDEVFDSVNDYHQYYRGSTGWASTVEEGLPVGIGDPDYVTRAYGGAIFPKYLSEHVDGQAAVFDVWTLIRQGRRILPALDAYARSVGFAADLPGLFLGFAGANAVMDYEEGASYGTVPDRSADNTLAASGGTLVDGGGGGGGGTGGGGTGTTDGGGGGGGCFVDALSVLREVAATVGVPVPAYLGATYLLKQGGTGTGVRVDLTGDPAGTWGLAAVARRQAGYAPVLGRLGTAGQVSFTLGRLDPGDDLFAVPCYLDSGAAAAGYATSESTAIATDFTAPGPVPALTATATAGGFEAAWGAAEDAGGVAGYVVRWSGAGGAGVRTLFGPVTGIRVRQLGVGTYDVEVFAYDASGNAADTAPASVAVTVVQPGADTPTPAVTVVRSNLP